MTSKIDSASWAMGQADMVRYEVSKGTKPVAMLAVHVDAIEEAREYIENTLSREGLQWVLDCHSCWVCYYVYKFPHLRVAISYSLGVLDKEDESILSGWVNGKMFGYGESEIAKYLKRVHGDKIEIHPPSQGE